MNTARLYASLGRIQPAKVRYSAWAWARVNNDAIAAAHHYVTYEYIRLQGRANGRSGARIGRRP